MKICIQHRATRKFLRGIDSWVDGRAGARHFVNSMDAVRHCVEHGLAAVNIVIDYGSSRVPLIIPVEAGDSAAENGSSRLAARGA